MQHIPLPHNPTIGYIEVPCLTEQEYDGGDLEMFPARQGYGDRTALEWKNLFDNPTPEFVAFMQLWQYFGSLSWVFGVAAVELFTKVCNGGSRVVDTSNLIAMIDDYVESTPEGYEIQDGDLKDRIDRSNTLMGVLLLKGVISITTTTNTNGRLGSDVISLYKFMTTFDYRNPLPVEILDSLWLLRDLLNVVGINFPSPFTLQQWRQPDTNGPGIPYPLMAAGHLSRAYEQRMLDRGWCPSRIRECMLKLRLTDLVHVANLPRHENLNHESCTRATCCHACVDESSYHTRHATSCDGCSSVAADVERMSAILEEGAYPVIDLFGPITAEKKLCLSSVGNPRQIASFSHAPIPYVAISHIWSDGLGNPRANSIPFCQLSDLRRLVRNVPHPPDLGPYSSFWLDTICCPVEDGSDIQTMAIAKMKSTYENASAVLVLDHSLLTHSAHNLSDVEILWRIVCSKWTSRLWTLQEGALARRIFFQFADGPYDFQSGLSRIVASADPSVRLVARQSILYHIEQLRISVNSSDQAGALQTLANAVLFRSTSVNSDEPLCLANLLRIDSSTIAQVPASDSISRMAAFWKLVSYIPLPLIFDKRERLSQPGFRWAPASLLQDEGATLLDIRSYESVLSTTAKRTESGLLFQAPGVVVSSTSTSELPAMCFLGTANGGLISVETYDELPVHCNTSGPLMIICLIGFVKGIVDRTLGLVVEELGGSSQNQFHARIIERVGVRMLWEGQEDVWMESVADASVVSEVVTLDDQTMWYIK